LRGAPFFPFPSLCHRVVMAGLDDFEKVLTWKTTAGSDLYPNRKERRENMEKEYGHFKLPGETFVNLERKDVDFEIAKNAAVERVRKYDSDPMLLAWYDEKSGRMSPRESCEEEGGQPGWINYAKKHGGNLTVNVNQGEYIFIFKSEHSFPA